MNVHSLLTTATQIQHALTLMDLFCVFARIMIILERRRFAKVIRKPHYDLETFQTDSCIFTIFKKNYGLKFLISVGLVTLLQFFIHKYVSLRVIQNCVDFYSSVLKSILKPF